MIRLKEHATGCARMFLVLATLLAPLPGAAQAVAEPEKSVDPLSGEWDMDVETGGGEHRFFMLRLERRGTEISGTVIDRGMPVVVERGKFSENHLSFGVNYQGTTYQLRAGLNGAKLDGNWEGGGSTGPWKAQKRKADPEEPVPGGLWQCRVTSGNVPDPTFTLNLKQQGSEISGMASSPRGSAAVKGLVKGRSIEISIATDEGSYLLMGTLEKGKLQGRWQRSDNRAGTWEGEKK